MLKILKLSFLPKSPDYGLLILRVTLGFSMLLLHGRVKILGFSSMAEKFPGLPFLPGNVNLSLAIFAEVVCSALLIAGLFTRFAALMLAITMGVAFFFVHRSALVDVAASNIKSGELAMVYLVAYVTLLFTGPGKFSVDRE
ncbi:DoxX family protein [Prosthecobacter sp.]|uniref:DoxX family protein n=1 Tax=Prosthecobacter sp. TaxID=1965333 RepID=UPI0037848AD0